MRTSKVLLTIALLSNLFAIPAFAGETLESSYKGDDYLMFARVSGKPADNDATHIEFRRLQKAYLSGSTTTTVQPTVQPTSAISGESLELSYKGDDYLMFARVSGKPADNDTTHIEFRRLQKAYLSGSTTTTVQPTSVIPNTNNSDTEQVTVPVVQPTKPNQPKPRVKTRKPNKPGYTINHGNKKIKIMFIFN